MLKNTFCHVPGISLRGEGRLWAAGIDCWEAAAESREFRLPRRVAANLPDFIRVSIASLADDRPQHFAALLRANQHWRLFPEFRHTLAYLDIETTGLGYDDEITTIVIYDGHRVRHYVQGQNLEQFEQDIFDYAGIVTYNGKCFDVPVIERYFRMRLDHAHIDLRYVLGSLGYKGGLKACERQLAIGRGDLSDVDGFFAVLLWRDFKWSRNPRALETLLAYNATDVVNLEALLVKAYNLKLRNTPFEHSHYITEPEPATIPFVADRDTIRRLKQGVARDFGYWHA